MPWQELHFCLLSLLHLPEQLLIFLINSFLIAWADWAVDTDLSAADASFWGEAALDRSGSKVAWAGDVNNDGYNDLLIHAPGNDENGQDSGQTYLFLGEPAGWAMDTNL